MDELNKLSEQIFFLELIHNTNKINHPSAHQSLPEYEGN